MNEFVEQMNAWWAIFAFKNMGAAGRRKLWMKLSKYLKNGVPIRDALLDIRTERMRGGRDSDPQTIALKLWSESINNGFRFSDAIKQWVNSEEIMLIQAGDESGDLQSALASVSKLMISKKKIRSAVLKATLYPTGLTLVGFSVTYFFGATIVPKFVSLMRCEWSGIASALVTVSSLMINFWWIILLSITGIFSWFFWSLPRLDGRIRVILDRYPPYSVYRVMHGSSWLIALASMVDKGMKIDVSIEKMILNSSPWMKRRLEAILMRINAGDSNGEALVNTGLEFPDREIIADIGTYSKQSGFNEALAILGNEWQDEAVERIDVASGFILIGGIVVVGAILGFLIFGMMQMELQLSACMQSGVH